MTTTATTSTAPHTLDLASATNPYVFLVGSPRSGTTMLKRMVDAHPLITITRETHWIPRYFEKQRGVTAEGLVTDQIVDQLFEHHRFEQMKFRREKLERLVRQEPQLSYAQLVSRIFDHYGQRRQKPLVGDKTPTYVRKIPTLHALWPQAKFIHLIRDGREVWLSMKNWRMAEKSAGLFSTWEQDPLVTTALWWKALIAMGRRDGQALGRALYHEVHYRDLVAQPARTCRELAQFLQVSYDEAMENYYEGHTQDDTNLSTNAAWLPPTPGRRNWRNDMSREELQHFEAASGNLLEDLGYELTCCTIPASVRRHVAQIKQQFAEEVADRWTLPEIW